MQWNPNKLSTNIPPHNKSTNEKSIINISDVNFKYDIWINNKGKGEIQNIIIAWWLWCKYIRWKAIKHIRKVDSTT